jgi:2-hydroxy-3-keto-5-methylthiopentenyl-1-phosphate phosphatase
MKAWFEQDLQWFSKSGLKQHNFADMFVSSKLMCRNGTSQMMKLMGKNDIPFLVVSGGISELIEAHLEAIS